MKGILGKWGWLVLAVVFSAVVLSGCGKTEQLASGPAPAGQGKAEAIKIGAILPLSGPAADSGQQMRNGYRTALKELEKKGWVLNGRKIELLIEDGKGDPTTSVAALEKLITKDGVEIVLGTISSTVDVALAEPMKKYQPIFACTGGASTLVEKAFGDAPWFFHYHPWEYDNIKALGKCLTEIGGPGKLVVAHEDGIFGTTNINMIKELIVPMGFELAKTLSFKSGSPDLSSVLTLAKKTEHDYFIWIGYPADATTIATQMKELNYGPKFTVGYTPGWPQGFATLPQGNYMGALSLWSPSVPTPESQEFVKLYTEAIGEKPQTYWAPMAYINLMTVADAINKAGSTKKEAVIAALEQGEWKTALGALKFHKSRISPHAGFDDRALALMQWQGGKQEVIAPKEKATAQAVFPVPPWDKR